MTYYGGVPAGFGYYGQPAAFGLTPNGYGYYGGYGEEPYLAEDMPYGETEPYGYYAEFPQMGAWAEAEPYGAYDPVGYFAEDYPVGWPGSAPWPHGKRRSITPSAQATRLAALRRSGTRALIG